MRLMGLPAAAVFWVSLGIGFRIAAAQVAPAATVGRFPISISVGLSDYNLDYGPGRRMQGAVVRAGWNIFHSLGVDGDVRSIFMNTPAPISRMQQSTFLGGVFYEAPPVWRIRPFARMGGGVGLIEFPSRNRYYSRDTFSVYAPSGGFEFPMTDRLSFRADYEYQFWEEFHGPHDLTPQGGTVGVSYYFQGRRFRPDRD